MTLLLASGVMLPLVLVPAGSADPTGPSAEEMEAFLQRVHAARAQALADLRAVDAADDLSRSVAVAKVGGDYQARVLGYAPRDPAPLVTHALPSAAVVAYAAQRGVVLTPQETARFAQHDGLPEPARGALAGLIDAFAAFDQAARSASGRADRGLLADLTGAGWPAPLAFQASGLDVSNVLPERERLLDAAEDFVRALDPAALPPGLAFVPCTGGIQVGTPFVDAYTVDCPVTIDLGASDVYTNNAGGTANAFPTAFLVDPQGDDQYVSWRSKGINGGGYNGAWGMLFDASGNDVYRAGAMPSGTHSAVNGAGTDGGFGHLVDSAGDDRYEGGTGGSQGGAGYGGFGLLSEGAGNDRYSGHNGTRGFGGANGGGFEGGVGWLTDEAGNDVYVAGSVGVNGGTAWCGAGFLRDRSGDDRYDARFRGVNGGSSTGTAALLDESGNDRYVALGAGSNGGAAADTCLSNPASFGGLDDLSGCDYYSDPSGTGFDLTVPVKGTVGHQVDAPALGCGLTAVDFAGGWDHTCVVTPIGTGDCYGGGSYGQQADYPGSPAASRVGAGLWHTCFVLANGNADCQGRNLEGQAVDYLGGNALDMDGGMWHTCLLLNNGNVDCYGNVTHGQSADYVGGNAVSVNTGTWHSCALLNTGNVDCWGDNAYGQSADYLGGDAIALGAGGSHTCVVLTSGNVDCWGSNISGEGLDYLGGDAVGVAAGRLHTCVLRSNGNVLCYGENASGQSTGYAGGDGVQVESGQDHTCVRRTVGTLDCWGANNQGQGADWP